MCLNVIILGTNIRPLIKLRQSKHKRDAFLACFCHVGGCFCGKVGICVLLAFQTEPQTRSTETRTGAASTPSVTSSTMTWRGERTVLFGLPKPSVVGEVVFQGRRETHDLVRWRSCVAGGWWQCCPFSWHSTREMSTLFTNASQVFFFPSTVRCTHSVAVADDHCLLCSSDNIKTLNFAHENPAATVDDDDDVMLQIFGREHCGLAKN